MRACLLWIIALLKLSLVGAAKHFIVFIHLFCEVSLAECCGSVKLLKYVFQQGAWALASGGELAQSSAVDAHSQSAARLRSEESRSAPRAFAWRN